MFLDSRIVVGSLYIFLPMVRDVPLPLRDFEESLSSLLLLGSALAFLKTTF